MKDFVCRELFEEGLWHGCNCDRIPNGIEDLNRIAYLSSIGWVAVNNRCHISTSEVFFWDVPRKRDLLKGLELHRLLPLSGYRVMNFVTPLLASLIHTVRTLRATPLGPASDARISKYSP
jgi:hypothetical protein